MAITTKSGLLTALKGGISSILYKAAYGAGTAIYSSMNSASAGDTTNGLIPDNTFSGAFFLPAAVTGKTRYLGEIRATGVAGSLAHGYIIDRLFHAGAFSVTATGTASLTTPPSYSSRLPAGDYLETELYLEVTTAFTTATAMTLSVNYKNENGTGGQTATFAETMANFSSKALLPMRLAAGDRGVSAIESITVGGTAAGAGAVNIVVMRKLAPFNGNRAYNIYADQNAYAVGLPIIPNSACIGIIYASGQNGITLTEIKYIYG